jgi:RND family efflux transporter MFP subunit
MIFSNPIQREKRNEQELFDFTPQSLRRSGRTSEEIIMENKPDIAALKMDASLRNGSRNGNRFWKKGIIIGVLVGLVVGAGYLFTQKTTEITAYTVGMDTASNGAVLTANGYVEARRKATVASKVTARIKAVYVEEGMKVAEGHVLALLDDDELRAQLAVAEADLNVTRARLAQIEPLVDLAERNRERNEALYKQNAISIDTLDTIQTEAKRIASSREITQKELIAGEARIHALKVQLEDYRILAPFSGIAISRDAQVGEMVSPISAGGSFTRTGISTLVDMDSLEVVVDVNEFYISKVFVGQETEAVLDAFPDWKIPAQVLAIIPAADRQKATIQVRITFNEKDPRILPDMGVKVYFIAPPEARNSAALIIPAKTIGKVEGQTFVWLIQEKKLIKRSITVGKETDAGIEIVEGLTAGDQIAAQYADTYHNGQHVRLSN